MPESERALPTLRQERPDARRPLDGPIDDLPRLVTAAALGLVVEAQHRLMDVAIAIVARFAWPIAVVAHPAASVALRSVAVARHHLDLDRWAARGLSAQRRSREAVTRAVRALVAAAAAAVLDEVDVDAVVARVDVDRIVTRIDIDAIAARIDLDRIAERLDVDAVVARIDLPGLVEQVIDEMDLGELIRESSSTMASETVDALRMQGMRADGTVNRIVDRILFRQVQRQTGPLPGQPRP